MTIILSRYARPEARFVRVRSGIPPEKIPPPLRGWWRDLAAGAGLLVFLAVIMLLFE